LVADRGVELRADQTAGAGDLAAELEVIEPHVQVLGAVVDILTINENSHSIIGILGIHNVLCSSKK
jgi:hypothetical protein